MTFDADGIPSFTTNEFGANKFLDLIENSMDGALQAANGQLVTKNEELNSALGEKNAFFSVDGQGNGFDSSTEIGAAINGLDSLKDQAVGFENDASALGDAVTTANALGVYYTQDQVDAAALANYGVVAGQPNQMQHSQSRMLQPRLLN